MELIESLNKQIADIYGIDTASTDAMWRVVWSDDQLEKRLMDHTPEGITLLFPAVFEVRKYPYVKAKYVLERLVVIPEINRDELPTAKLSYEPMYVFNMQPSMLAVQFIIDSVYAALGKKSMAKYVDPETTEEAKQERITRLHEELFGNETDVGDALAYKQGVTVPRNYGDSDDDASR